MAKVYRACSDQRITNNFLFCNDDYFFLKPFNAVEYPFYYKCDLNHTLRVPNNGEYNLHVKPTVDILAATGRNILNFDTHYPIRYNKQMFKHMADSFNWNIPHGYIVKSMYCNFHRFAGTHKLDCKVNHQMPKDHIPGHLAGKEMFSTGESAMNAYMKKHIESLYPEKSKYEL